MSSALKRRLSAFALGLVGIGVLVACAGVQADAPPAAASASSPGAPVLMAPVAAPSTADAPSQQAVPSASNPQVLAYLKDPAAVKRGRQVFVGTCGAYCHSNQNVARDAPYLFDCEWKHGGTDDEIFKSISAGVPNTRMPAWGGALPDGDADIWRVIAYLRSASTCAAPAPAQAH